MSRALVLAVAPVAVVLALAVLVSLEPGQPFLRLATSMAHPAPADTTPTAVTPPDHTPTALPASAPPPTATAAAPTTTPPASPTATPAAQRPAPPQRLRIPSIRVDAPIVTVGVTAEGEMEAPDKADDVGWLRSGPRPGEQGNALMAGHVDWLYSTAVFWYLGRVEPGDEVIVIDADGREFRFTVEWKELYAVDSAPMERIVGPTSVPAVTLITCGGQFDRTARSYTHRWVVRAVAASEPDLAGHPRAGD